MAVTEHPQGIIGRELGFGFKMQPAAQAGAVIKKTTGVPDPCPDPLFFLWKVVISNVVDSSVVAVVEVTPSGNAGSPIPFPDGCFRFEVFRGGCLPSGACMEWALSGFSDPDFNLYTDSDHLVTLDGCNGCLLLYNPVFPSIVGSLAAFSAAFDLTATVNGDPYGPTISFACDPSAYPSTFQSWVQGMVNPFGEIVTAPHATFQTIWLGNRRYFMQLDGLLWDNPSDITWTVTQSAGPAIPDPSYFQVVAPHAGYTVNTRCAVWDIEGVDNYDYSDCVFSLQAYLNGNPFGYSIGWTAGDGANP